MLYTRTPEELRLILIDPKMLEFELYQDIPHLLHPVVTDAKLASAALKWACDEMDERYRAMARWKARNIEGFNERVTLELENWTPAKARQYAPSDWPEHEPIPRPKKLPYIVIVIDELADLMMVAAKDVEVSIARLAQKARAAGIHLIVATQTPRADVITGVIKANIPTRIAFQVASALDSRVILDRKGAENLVGKGDMLYVPPGGAQPIRSQGALVTDDEILAIVNHCVAQGKPIYDVKVDANSGDFMSDGEDGESSGVSSEEEETLEKCLEVMRQEKKASTSLFQRRLRLGYGRAARMMDILEMRGIIGPGDGAKPREILVSMDMI
jgi:S-DNA-T family DNA segregation ATPase FtsK/SpoIIIE